MGYHYSFQHLLMKNLTMKQYLLFILAMSNVYGMYDALGRVVCYFSKPFESDNQFSGKPIKDIFKLHKTFVPLEQEGIYSLSFNKDYVVIGLKNGFIEIRSCNGDLLRVLQSNHESVVCLNMDDQIIIAGYADGYIKVWDIQKACCLKTIHINKIPLSFVKLKNSFLVGTSDGVITGWSLQEEDLHYLSSRVNKQEAEKLLKEAFIYQTTQEMPLFLKEAALPS